MTYPSRKKCLYCGRINPGQAMQCAGCGAGSFVPLPPEPVYAGDSSVAARPVEQINPAIRALYFFFFGLLVAFYWLLASLGVLLTIVAQPLAAAMFRLLPTIATLHRNEEPVGQIMSRGWQDSVARYKAAPLWAKLLAPLTLAVYIVALGIFFTQR